LKEGTYGDLYNLEYSKFKNMLDEAETKEGEESE